jgi:aryl-alcohol dehydrogenase-like predicted oxidoreductase
MVALLPIFNAALLLLISAGRQGSPPAALDSGKHNFMEADAGTLSGLSGVSATRREFLHSLGMAGLGSALAVQANAQSSDTNLSGSLSSAKSQEIPKRRLGKTNAEVSALGVGGHHLGDIEQADDAIQLIHTALDAGVTFFDNCWEYYNGEAETTLGRGLKGHRNRVFLMTKVCTHGRSSDIAMRMLEQSLRRLQTDHLEMWQLHAISYDNDPELAYAKGGVLEALDKAKQQGKTRFGGFTGHKSPAFHMRMLELGYPFDTVQMPLNPFDANYQSFEKEVLPEANRRGIAVLGMKSMGGTGDAVKKGVVSAAELLRYAMSLPVAVTISGMDSMKILQQNLEVARGFKPMSPAEMEGLRAKCASFAADGRFEVYKGSLRFDNPVTRMPHGFPVDQAQKEVKAMLKKGTGTWETV